MGWEAVSLDPWPLFFTRVHDPSYLTVVHASEKGKFARLCWIRSSSQALWICPSVSYSQCLWKTKMTILWTPFICYLDYLVKLVCGTIKFWRNTSVSADFSERVFAETAQTLVRSSRLNLVGLWNPPDPSSAFGVWVSNSDGFFWIPRCRHGHWARRSVRVRPSFGHSQSEPGTWRARKDSSSPLTRPTEELTRRRETPVVVVVVAVSPVRRGRAHVRPADRCAATHRMKSPEPVRAEKEVEPGGRWSPAGNFSALTPDSFRPREYT